MTAETVAPPITEPVGSVTVPEIEPVPPVWANRIFGTAISVRREKRMIPVLKTHKDTHASLLFLFVITASPKRNSG